jgi:GNAT superfamily N-acetyltransferase
MKYFLEIITLQEVIKLIRELKEQDKEKFISMVDSFFHSEAVLHAIPKEYILNTYNEVISGSPFAKVYIIEEQGEIAGYGQVSLTYSNEAGGMVVWIEELYIHEQFRGLGLGSAFLDFIKKEYALKAKRIRLELCESNKAAEKLYLKKGFTSLDYKQMLYE